MPPLLFHCASAVPFLLYRLFCSSAHPYLVLLCSSPYLSFPCSNPELVLPPYECPLFCSTVLAPFPSCSTPCFVHSCIPTLFYRALLPILVFRALTLSSFYLCMSALPFVLLCFPPFVLAFIPILFSRASLFRSTVLFPLSCSSVLLPLARSTSVCISAPSSVPLCLPRFLLALLLISLSPASLSCSAVLFFLSWSSVLLPLSRSTSV